MTEQKKLPQSLLVSDSEIALLKSVFAENDDLLRTVRNLFFGLELTQDEKTTIISTFANDDIKQLMKKRFLPSITNKEAPIGQTVDMWVGVEVRGKHPTEIFQLVSARKNQIEMIRQALALLENPDGDKIIVEFNPLEVKQDDLQIELLTRNNYISHIETQLIMIKVIAGQKEETVAQATKRMGKDSNE